MRALKEKIESEKGKDAFPVAGQKLIYAGKILNDDTALKEYKIDEKNFVVVMVTKVSFSLLVYIFIHVSLKKKSQVFLYTYFLSENSIYTSIVACT